MFGLGLVLLVLGLFCGVVLLWVSWCFWLVVDWVFGPVGESEFGIRGVVVL